MGLEDQARRQRAGGIGGEQHAVVEIGVVVAEIGGEFRHLRLIGIADDERRRGREQRHRHDDAVAGDLARGREHAGEAALAFGADRGSLAKAGPNGAFHSHQVSGT